MVSLFLLSCSKDVANKEDVGLQHIPKTASSVSVINLKNLMQKADFEAVQQMDFYQASIEDMKKEGEEVAAAILENPEQSGVDLDKNAYLTYLLDANNPENIFIGLVLNLKDEGGFFFFNW